MPALTDDIAGCFFDDAALPEAGDVPDAFLGFLSAISLGSVDGSVVLFSGAVSGTNSTVS